MPQETTHSTIVVYLERTLRDLIGHWFSCIIRDDRLLPILFPFENIPNLWCICFYSIIVHPYHMHFGMAKNKRNACNGVMQNERSNRVISFNHWQYSKVNVNVLWKDTLYTRVTCSHKTLFIPSFSHYSLTTYGIGWESHRMNPTYHTCIHIRECSNCLSMVNTLKW